MSTPSLARRERLALCDLALALGEDSPTLCGDWTAKQLVEHLLVRERSPLAAAGIAVPGLSGLAEREMARTGRRDFEVLVERLRTPGLTPYALPLVERTFNTLEYFVHHEDLRRARPGWAPRPLADADQHRLWRAIRVGGRGLVRAIGVPVRIRRSDTDAVATLRHGADPVTITGMPSELVMFLFGRDQAHGLEFEGPAERVGKVRRADLGL